MKTPQHPDPGQGGGRLEENRGPYRRVGFAQENGADRAVGAGGIGHVQQVGHEGGPSQLLVGDGVIAVGDLMDLSNSRSRVVESVRVYGTIDIIIRAREAHTPITVEEAGIEEEKAVEAIEEDRK